MAIWHSVGTAPLTFNWLAIGNTMFVILLVAVHALNMSKANAGEKPKKNSTAYTFFLQAYRDEMKKKGGAKIPFAEMSKQCGEQWSVSLSSLIRNEDSIVCEA